MGDVKKEQTLLDELVADLERPPEYDPEKFAKNMEDPLFRRMFCKGAQVRRDVCRGEIPIPESLKDAVIAMGEYRDKQKKECIMGKNWVLMHNGQKVADFDWHSDAYKALAEAVGVPAENLETRNEGNRIYGVRSNDYAVDLNDSVPYICLSENIA